MGPMKRLFSKREATVEVKSEKEKKQKSIPSFSYLFLSLSYTQSFSSLTQRLFQNLVHSIPHHSTPR